MSYNEQDTRAKLIDPALYKCGWHEDFIRREVTADTVEIINGKAKRSIIQGQPTPRVPRVLKDNETLTQNRYHISGPTRAFPRRNNGVFMPDGQPGGVRWRFCQWADGDDIKYRDRLSI